jgi:L-fucose isomerase-like protein
MLHIIVECYLKGEQMMEKMVLGLLPIAKKNQYQGEIKRFLDYIRVGYGDDTCHLLIPDGVLYDEEQILETTNEFAAKGADALVYVLGSWVYSSLVITSVNDLQVPFVVYGISDQIANGNLGISLQIKYVLQEMGKNFLYLCGKVDEVENYATIRRFLTAAWASKMLRNKKIATIGGKCMMMYQTQVNEFDWKKVFGVDFPQYDTVQVLHETKNVDEQEAKQIADNFLAKFDKVNWKVSEIEEFNYDAVLFQAKLFLAFKRMKKLYGIEIFANKCMPELVSSVYGYSSGACLATCMLNEDGIMTACEADVPAGLSMYILHLLSNEKVFFADISKLDKEKKLISFFNCGTAPISLADKKKGMSLWPIPRLVADEAIPYEYWTGKMQGASINFEMENGRTITLLRIGGNGDTLRFHAARAVTAPRDVREGEEQGIRWPGFGAVLKNDTMLFLRNTTGHHYSIVYGDWIDELRFLAQILGIKFVFDE